MKVLEGVQIVSIEQFGAAPYATMLLANLGAEVIKVENASIGGDPARRIGPYMLGENDSQYFQAFNIGKQSVALDLRSVEGKKALENLITNADAVINNLRGDLPTRLNLDYASLSKIKPSIVCVHLSAYGRDNVRASWPGYDYLMQAESGLMDLTGEPSGPPTRIGAPSIIDQTAGLTAAVSLLAGIIHARSKGKGCDLDTCLFDVALHQLGYVATWYLNDKHISTRQERSAHYSVVPVQTFPTADGWIFLMPMTDRFYGELATAIDRPDLALDLRFITKETRLENRDALTEILDAELKKHSTDHWLQKFEGILPAAPILTLPQALDNPFLAETGMIHELVHPARPRLRLLANPIKVNGERLEHRVCPPLGENNKTYLGGLSEK